MTVYSLGIVPVPTHNVPVTLPANVASIIEIAPASTNTGAIYVLSAVTGQRICVLPVIPANGQGDRYRVKGPGDSLHLEQFAIDAAVNGEGAYVSYIQE